MKTDRISLIALLLVTLAVIDTGFAASEAPRDNASNALQYRPPLRGAPAKRVGAATRTVSGDKLITLIAPGHAGLTLRSQPMLYWHSARALSERKAVLRLISLDAEMTIDERPLGGANCAGIHRVNLAAVGLTLKPDLHYRWQVSVAAQDQEAAEIVASGSIRYAQTGEVTSSVASDPSVWSRRRKLAESGVWYDLVDDLLGQLKSPEGGLGPSDTFEKLLEQVGIRGDLARSAICY